MVAPIIDAVVGEPINPVEGKVVSVPSHQAINEKIVFTTHDAETSKDNALVLEKEVDGASSDSNSENVIIVTGADAAEHLLPMRDDGEPALTFRSILLASGLSAFQAVMSQIYSVCFVWAKIVYMPISTSNRLTLRPVQTDFSHHWGNFYRPHCLLSRQSMGHPSPPWR